MGTPAPGARGKMRSDIELTRAVIQTERQAIVSHALELTDAQSEKFWPLFREYRVERAKISDRLVKIILDYAEHYPNVTVDEARDMVDGYLDLQSDELKLRKRYLPRFRKILPEIKVTRLYQVENKLDAAIKLELAKSIPLIW
ncbi:MAG: hypothetical protein V3V67_19405 [Myxococcota bacterium]